MQLRLIIIVRLPSLYKKLEMLVCGLLQMPSLAYPDLDRDKLETNLSAEEIFHVGAKAKVLT